MQNSLLVSPKLTTLVCSFAQFMLVTCKVIWGMLKMFDEAVGKQILFLLYFYNKFELILVIFQCKNNYMQFLVPDCPTPTPLPKNRKQKEEEEEKKTKKTKNKKTTTVKCQVASLD